MVRYKNLGGHSGVNSFDIGADSITVKFSDGSTYIYTVASAGAYNIEKMKQLAKEGRGLNSYINKVVKHRFANKFR